MPLVFFLFSLLSLLFLFRNEIIIFFLQQLAPTTKILEGKWDLAVVAKGRSRIRRLHARPPQVRVFETESVEDFISIPSSLLGATHFVAKNLWVQWSEEEREAILLWSHSMHLRHGLFTRIFFLPDVFTVDRDTVLEATHALALLPALEKAAIFKGRPTPKTLLPSISGLGLLGPSLTSSWPPLESRFKKLASYLEKLEPSQ